MLAPARHFAAWAPFVCIRGVVHTRPLHHQVSQATMELSSMIDEELQATGPFQVDRLHAKMKAYMLRQEPTLDEVRGVIPKVVLLCNFIAQTAWSMNARDIDASAALLTALAISVRMEPELSLAAGNMLRHLCRQALQPFVLPTLTGTTTVSLLEGLFCWPRGTQDSDLASRLGKHLAQPHVMKQLHPDALAALCCYQVQAPVADWFVLDAIGAHLAAPQQCSRLTLREVVDLLSTYAQLGVAHGPLLEAIADRMLEEDLPDFSLVDTVNCLSAFAMLRWKNEHLMGMIQQHALQVGLKCLPLYTISKLLHAFASLDWHGIGLFTAASDLIKRQGLERCDPSDVCTISWTFAVAPYIDDSLFMLLLRFCPEAEQVEPESLALMHQFILHIQQHSDMLHMSPPYLLTHPSIARRCEAAFQQTPVHCGGGAPEAPEIEEVLHTMGLQASTSTVLRDAGMYAADVLLSHSRVVIDVDGPEKFISCDSRRLPSGSTLLRRRHLNTYGYRVVSVSPQQWEQLPTLVAKQAYLQDRLPKVINPADLLPLQVSV
eukprot:GGOE01023439.1.p1 GENE.GGOE01023439.1~~GGOE01023439.1.p1  ORF type:complete len:547 (-),score=128.29 GGOE01023439.1:811-2451(-)